MRSWFSLILFLFLHVYCGVAQGDKGSTIVPSSPAETLLSQRARDGIDTNVASLGNSKDARKIRPEFLQSLLLQLADTKDPPRAIRLTGAEITGQFSMKRAYLPFTLSVNGCIFDDFVAVQDVTFGQPIEVENSQFTNGLVLENVIIKGNMIFDG